MNAAAAPSVSAKLMIGAAVSDSADRAEVWPDQHPRREPVRLDADELDPQQLGEGQRVGVDAVDRRHGLPLFRA